MWLRLRGPAGLYGLIERRKVRGITRFLLLILASLILPPGAAADPAGRAHYLANASVMVAHGAAKVVFDPLFRNDFGQYERVPAEMEQALFAGEPPFDDIDAIFISHSHEDHFDTGLMLEFLVARTEIHLYAPAQAVADMERAAAGGQGTVFDRVHAVTPEYGAPPVRIEVDDLLIEAARIPHSGWPNRMTDVENIAFRVTLDNATTVIHLGDADPRREHFAPHVAHWNPGHTHLALPPYWFFLSAEGRRVIAEQVQPDHAIGVHVPRRMPDDPADRPAELQGFDLFTEPGETRDIPSDLGR